MEKCPICDELAVQKDSHYCQEQLVCTSCGYVVSQDNLLHDNNNQGTTSVPFNSKQSVKFNIQKLPRSIGIHNYQKIPEGKSIPLERIDYLKSVLNFGRETTDEIKQLYLKMFDHHNFSHCSLQSKIALAACCAYLVLRRRRWPILVSFLCNLLQCCASEFNTAFKTTVELTGIRVVTPELEELVPVVLEKVDLGQERKEVLQKVKSLLKLASECWLTAGRIPQPCILASTFLAWKSMSQKRLNYTFQEFCREKNVNEFLVSSRTRLNELNQTLLNLAEKFPWVEKGELKQNHVPYLLDGILKNFWLMEHQSDSELEFRKGLKRKTKNCSEDEKGEIFSENFDDSEIDIYIRTEEEVANLQHLEKKLKK